MSADSQPSPRLDITPLQLVVGFVVLIGVLAPAAWAFNNQRTSEDATPGDATATTDKVATKSFAPTTSAGTAPETSLTTPSTQQPVAPPPAATILVPVQSTGTPLDDPFAATPEFGPVQLPSDCGLPSEPASLPGSPRDYRNGVHQGIDFICLERGRSAFAALDGRVVVAVGDYVDPSPEERNALLDVADQAGATPRYTLAMLYGNYVVLDHGVKDGLGHVFSIYAHLEALDPAVVPGAWVEIGSTLGEIGNTGTATAASNGDRPQSLHLHWEIHVDDLYFGAGLDGQQTEQLYQQLFS